ncbi:MAG: hypothetical protein K6F64_03365 [Clostridia bacterium]|nr:hypothetical protein [Clostridia bacterium]
MKNKLTAAVSVVLCLLLALSVFTACSVRKGDKENGESTSVTSNEGWSASGDDTYQPVEITGVELVELVSKALGDDAKDFNGDLSSLSKDQIDKVKKVAQQEGLIVDEDENGDVVIKKEEVPTTVVPSSLADEIMSEAKVENRTKLTPEEYSRVSKAAEDRGVTAVTDSKGNVEIVDRVTTVPSATTNNNNDTSASNNNPNNNNNPTDKNGTSATSAPASLPTGAPRVTTTIGTTHSGTTTKSSTNGPGITEASTTKSTNSVTPDPIGSFGNGASCYFSRNAATSDGGSVAVGNSVKNSAGEVKDYASGLIVKYADNGSIEWSSITSADETLNFSDVAVLKDGSIIAVGDTFATDFVSDAEYKCKDTVEGVIVKFSSSGKTLWKKLFGGSGDDIIYAVDATSDGGFVIGGKSDSADFDMKNTGTGIKAFVARYSADGTLAWATGLSGKKHCTVTDVAVGSDGSIFASVETVNRDGDFEGINPFDNNKRYALVVKYTPSGSLAWKDVLYETGNVHAKGVAPTTDGGVAVAGYYITDSKNIETKGTFAHDTDGNKIYNGGSYDGYVIKYDGSGKKVWLTTLIGYQSDFITGIDDISSGFAVSGYTTSNNRDFTFTNNGDFDSFVYVVSSAGRKNTVKSFAGSGSDRAMGVAGKGTNIYICGASTSSDVDFADCSSKSDGTSPIGFNIHYTANQV